MYYLVALISLFLICPIGRAWENHALLSAIAVADMPEVRDAKPVKVESLEEFLAAERLSVSRVLDEEERWARVQVPNYPERPERLRFDFNNPDKSTLRKRFLQAIRVNP